MSISIVSITEYTSKIIMSAEKVYEKMSYLKMEYVMTLMHPKVYRTRNFMFIYVNFLTLFLIN
jgi:hypothetical protein